MFNPDELVTLFTEQLSVLLGGTPQSPICAVQDPFGKAYRCLGGIYGAGEVLKDSVRHRAGANGALGENGQSELAFRIIKAVHVNTVHALLRRIPCSFRINGLAPGRWYEVHGD